MKSSAGMIDSPTKVLLVSFLAIGALVLIETKILTDRKAEPEPCTCEGRPEGCEVKQFSNNDGKYAFCAVWGNDQSCCMVDPRQ